MEANESDKQANARRNGVERRSPGARLPPDEQLAGIGAMHTVENVSGGGFSGAILPNDGVDGSRRDAQIDSVIGDDGVEALADIAKFDLRGSALWRTHCFW